MKQFKNSNFYILVLSDCCIFSISLLGAYALRFSFAATIDWERILFILPWVLVIKVATFFVLDIYRGMWRYFSFPDAVRLFKASALSSLIITSCLLFITQFKGYPRSVFIADAIFTFFLCGCLRAGIRSMYQRLYFLGRRSNKSSNNKRIMILGAGDATDKMIREVRGNANAGYDVVACLDDDPTKWHRSLHGIRIDGPIEKLQHFAHKYKAQEILIAIPSATGERMRHIVELCEEWGGTFKTLPSLTSLIDGNISISDLREVRFEDLLGRPPVKLDEAVIGEYLSHKDIAVTGAGGSIGSELCRQISRFSPKSITLIEASEFNLYRIEAELQKMLPHTPIHAILGRVQDRLLLERVFARTRPQVVFHAAACKHVPMVERNPWEAIHTNVQGSQTVMQASIEIGAERFVLISSDKAVRPTNIMGATKRAAEIILQSKSTKETRCMAVRFGNVVGSSGSVVPLFQEQIKNGGPVTVTDPEMTRYFMTIPEACQLVLQAGALGTGGEIFVLEMGTPVKIDAMARDLIRLSGKEPGRDIKIEYTGLRPGEKLFEELITHGEGIIPTEHEKILVLRRQNGTVSVQDCENMLSQLSTNANDHDAEAIKQTLKKWIDEYHPSTASCVLSRLAENV